MDVCWRVEQVRDEGDHHLEVLSKAKGPQNRNSVSRNNEQNKDLVVKDWYDKVAGWLAKNHPFNDLVGIVY